jgi:hypothetical protein
MRWVMLVVLLGTACSSRRGSSPDGGSPVTPDSGRAASPDSGSFALPDAGPTFRFSAEIVASGCAKAVACANSMGTLALGISKQGIGRCVENLTRVGVLDLKRYSWLLSIWDDFDWLLQIALMQNMACVQAASDCPAILGCLNQGRTETACTIPANYSGERRCSDTTHLRGCMFGIEMSFDCAELGLECVELTGLDNDRVLATCAARVTSGQPIEMTLAVTCEGDLARFKLGDGEFVFDCDWLGATCAPGSYALAEEPTYCVGKSAATCDAGSNGSRCEGDSLINCLGGHEAAWSCASWGGTCSKNDNPYYPACQFACAATAESCAGNVLGYCGPTGMTAIDCSALGFSSCGSDAPRDYAQAWCVP